MTRIPLACRIVRKYCPGRPGPAARITLAAVLALALCAAASAWPSGARAQAKTKLTVYVIDCGEADILKPERWAPNAPEDVPPVAVVRCYLIQHPRGSLLWGTGLSDGLIDKPEGVVIPNGALRLRVSKGLQSQLRRISVKPEDITYVSMSHMHGDHSGNGNLFTRSTFIIQQDEYDAAFGADPGKYGFNPDLYGKLKDAQVLKLNGDFDLFSDGSVVILRTPGHTPGHQSLFLDLPKMGPVVLSGDLWHFQANREKRRVPIFNFDAGLTLGSMKRLEEFIALHKATVWIEHDAAQHAKIPHLPTAIH